VLLIIRLAAIASFWGLAVALPGWLAGRRLVRGSPLRALLVGAVVVLLVAAAGSALTHRRMGRPVIAAAGALVAVLATVPGRR
jgi:hypothetical protein